MLGLFAQIETFFLTLLLGIVSGILFHYYQLTIKALQVEKITLYLLDLLFWLLMILLISIGLLLINQGELRIFIFLVLLAGSLIYFKWIAGLLKGPLDILAKSSAAIIKIIATITKKPYLWLKKLASAFRKRAQAPIPPDEP